ncbi:hypothetical protein ACVMIH_002368 [Bradyrhizobium sp. USDA 4503]
MLQAAVPTLQCRLAAPSFLLASPDIAQDLTRSTRSEHANYSNSKVHQSTNRPRVGFDRLKVGFLGIFVAISMPSIIAPCFRIEQNTDARPRGALTAFDPDGE